jgi:DNA repair photolyase
VGKVLFEEVLCKSLINRVHGDRLPFHWTINPYRGCQHACVYCFARSTHAYLGMDVGRDFDTRISVKVNAPEVLRQELRSPAWRGQLIALGTACDPYEPAEQKYQLTRRILEVLRDFHNPVSITTKGVLITRDLELLVELSGRAHCSVNFSVGTVDEKVWKLAEPQTPKPMRRLEAMERLAKAGIRTGVLLAPILPGLSDSPEGLEATVKAAAEHGAQYLAPNVLHLRPGSREWFMPFIREAYPHLNPLYTRLYKGPYAPEEYTERVLALVDALRERYRFNPRVQTITAPTGGLQMALPIWRLFQDPHPLSPPLPSEGRGGAGLALHPYVRGREPAG